MSGVHLADELVMATLIGRTGLIENTGTGAELMVKSQ